MPPLPTSRGTVLRWAGALAAICAATTLLVLLGMPVAGAVTSVPALALLAAQVSGTGTKQDPAPPPADGEARDDMPV
ncbi:hypothetical protein OG196_43305 (plasmid) [Kitasatospora purpeofusca]|uniref:hypothetical protein n=1 Tax=Kitasatospora purpeofusca TaxID=67352 RepID=UPI002E152ADB|nr:hypothetical protein OG196_43305 [Kitasatospora purpeofusca]